MIPKKTDLATKAILKFQGWFWENLLLGFPFSITTAHTLFFESRKALTF
jgi:hypothetical protein